MRICSSGVPFDAGCRAARRAGRLAAAGAALLLLLLTAPALLADGGQQADLPLPNKPDSVKFAVIGDGGTGGTPQFQIADQMVALRARFPFEFVLMLGDNIYGKQDFVKKFEAPYRKLLDAGVTFHATLGNHDDPIQLRYPHFNMNGQRWYTFAAPHGSVRFFSLDSDPPGREQQLPWLEAQLSAAKEDWKIAFLHHPPYSSGKTHGPDIPLRRELEPIFHQYGVQVVLSGHEHFYERLKPQQGITYFISGGAGKLRKGDIKPTSQTAKGFDTDNHFLAIEIDGETLYFAAVSRTGAIVDSGTIARDAASTAVETAR